MYVYTCTRISSWFINYVVCVCVCMHDHLSISCIVHSCDSCGIVLHCMTSCCLRKVILKHIHLIRKEENKKLTNLIVHKSQFA